MKGRHYLHKRIKTNCHAAPYPPLSALQLQVFNNLAGWLIFGLTTIVYTLAVEPTASFWDCGELIAASYKLQVPHAPGAPFFLLIGRAFALLAAEKSAVAFWVNMVSVLSSSFTVMFLYWSIVLLTRKVGKIAIGTETPYQLVMLMGSGLIGALAFSFSDSFWFSAEEAEVYAMSSFFMTILFWAALKWELIRDTQLENKWLILMAFLVGLSIGVHLLNLLVIPAMALIWYFKKIPQISIKGIILSIMAGLAIVGLIVIGIIPGLPSLAGWLSPFDVFANELPELLKRNKGRNNFLMLPLLLDIAGAVFQFRRNRKGFYLVALLFFMTSLGLVLYLNSTPTEPRERDYIFVGSFYAFSIWIGFGFYALASFLSEVRKQKSIQLALITASLYLVVPGIMASEGWDDHNRSDRFLSLDSARNALASCAPNAILFTGGDNDTYPLWYAQEVEGFRTDVRVIVLTYFNAAWYIEQMTRKVNDSEAPPFSLSEEHYRQGGLNDVIYYVENKNLKGALPLKQYLKLLSQNHPALQLSMQSETFNTLPAKTMSLNIDRKAVLAGGIIPEGKETLLTNQMLFQLKEGKHALYKSDLMVFDLSKYLVHEGSAYRLLPVHNPEPQLELVNTDIMYENLMNKFYFRGLDNPEVYFPESYRGQVLNLRSAFNTLAQALLLEGKTEKVRRILKHSLDKMPDKAVPYDITSALSVPLLLEVGEQDKALEIANILAIRADKTLRHLDQKNKLTGNELQINLVILSQLSRSMAAAGLTEKALEYQQLLGKHYGG